MSTSHASRARRFPIGAAVTLDALEHDPHPVLHALRAHEPVSWVPALNAWLVTRHDLVSALMRDAEAFTVDHPGFTTARVVGPSMLSLDGAAHQRHRRPFEAPFRLSAVRERFAQAVDRETVALLDALRPHGRADLRRALAGPLAARTMGIALGLGGVSVEHILSWYEPIVEAVTALTRGEPASPNEPVSAAGRAAYAALKTSLLLVLRRAPDSSLLAAAAGDGSLTDDEIVANAAILLFGGIETTEGMITNAFHHLLSQPTLHAACLRDTALLPAVIEESLRLEPAAAVVDRYATRAIHVADADIARNDLVTLSIAGANRDPAVFADPDRFAPDRPNLRSHVTFAQGPHVCLGLHLARLEAHAVLQHALTRLAGLRLTRPTRPTGLVFRKVKALEVAWDVTHR
jgi:cytochrome P450